MLNNYEMSSVCVDTGVMWRLSEDFNRRFAARVHQQSHHVHHHHHRPTTMAMIYNGTANIQSKLSLLFFNKNTNFLFFKFLKFRIICDNLYTTCIIQL